MKKTILNILIIIYILLIGSSKAFGYTAEEYLSFYYEGTLNWVEVYNIPEGKDFVLNYIYSDNTGGNFLGFADNGLEVGLGNIVESKNEIFIVFKENVELIDSNPNNHYTVTGFLVDEDEDISSYITGSYSAFGKHIFSKEDIDFIYFREFIFFIFIMIIKFFELIIGRKLLIR